MTFVPIPNGVRVVHLGHVGQQQIVHTFGAQNGANGVGGPLNDIAKSHGDAWRAQILPQLHNVYSHDATLAYSLEDASKAAGDAGYAGSVAGGGAGTVGPLSMAVVVSMKTAKRGRTYQGRVYLGPWAQTWNAADGVSWQAGMLATVQTKINAYKAAVDPNLSLQNNGALAVCSKGSPANGIAPHITPVTACLVRPYIGTQRRRLR